MNSRARIDAHQHVLPTVRAEASPFHGGEPFDRSTLPWSPEDASSPLTASSLSLNADDRLSRRISRVPARMGDILSALAASLRGLRCEDASVCVGLPSDLDDAELETNRDLDNSVVRQLRRTLRGCRQKTKQARRRLCRRGASRHRKSPAQPAFGSVNHRTCQPTRARENGASQMARKAGCRVS